MITPENINRVGCNHPSRTHNRVGSAMKKSSPNLTAQTPRFRHKDNDSDIEARKCHSQLQKQTTSHWPMRYNHTLGSQNSRTEYHPHTVLEGKRRIPPTLEMGSNHPQIQL